MTLSTRISGNTGKSGKTREAHVHPFVTATGIHEGLVILNHRLIKTEPTTKFFVNDTVGIAMNQDVSFGTTGNILHDGGTTSSALVAGTCTAAATNKLTDTTSPPFEAGEEDDATIVGMTVENTTDSTYARISAIDSTSVLSLTTIASKGETGADIFPAGTEGYLVNAVWVGAATTGTWDFATGNVITQAAANNNDQADITANAADQSLASDFTALTGAINLNTYTEVNHNIQIQMTLSGVAVGSSILLNDFIDTGDFGAQQFSIPIGDLVATDQLMNGIRIIVLRTGGAKPAFTLDDVRLEFSGTPLVFEVALNKEERFHISELVFTYADALLSEKTGLLDATETFTNNFLSYDAILGVSALTNGFVINRTKKGKTLFSANIKTLGGHISAGATIGELITDNANTFLTLRVIFPDPLILTGEIDDTLTITINDKMDGLLQFTAAARGSLETP